MSTLIPAKSLILLSLCLLKVPLTVCEWFKDYQPAATGRQEVEHAYEYVLYVSIVPTLYVHIHVQAFYVRTAHHYYYLCLFPSRWGQLWNKALWSSRYLDVIHVMHSETSYSQKIFLRVIIPNTCSLAGWDPLSPWHRPNKRPPTLFSKLVETEQD